MLSVVVFPAESYVIPFSLLLAEFGVMTVLKMFAPQVPAELIQRLPQRS
jgi:hypothetical protein